MASVEVKSLEAPDEVRTFDKGRNDVVRLGGVTLGRVTLEPGWRWSASVKPTAGDRTNAWRRPSLAPSTAACAPCAPVFRSIRRESSRSRSYRTRGAAWAPVVGF